MKLSKRICCLFPQGITQLITYPNKQVDLSLIPLTQVKANVSIYGGLTKIQLEHQYKNTSKEVLQTKFSFPVDPDTAVSSLTIVSEEKELQAKIMKKEKADEKYDDAVSSGNAAYKLQYDKDQQDLLTMNIGNLMPDKSLTVKLGLVQKLEVFDKSWLLSLSPTFTPRYYNKAKGNQNQEEELKVQEDPLPQAVTTPAVSAKKLPYTFNVIVDIMSNGPIQRLVSASHEVDITYSDDKCSAKVNLKGETAPNADFNLLFRSKDINQPIIFLQESQNHKNEVASLVTFFPDFCPPPSATSQQQDTKDTVDYNSQKLYQDPDEEQLLEGSGQYIFVIDRSGSMGGNRIRMAVEAATLFIQSLPQKSTFNVVSFGSRYQSMFKNSVKYDQKNLQIALKNLEKFDANMGGTEIYGPLDSVYKSKYNPEYPVNIFLITDGGVGNADQIIDLIHKNVQRAKCHSFGIGSGASQYLVKQAAIAGNGTYQFITDNEGNMNAKVIASLSKAVKPALVDFKVNWPNKKDILVDGNQKIGNVFHGQKFTMHNILKDSFKKGNLEIKCVETQTQKPKKFILDLTKAIYVPKGEDLFQICSRIAINDMKYRDKKDNKELQRVSLKYQVLSSETAFLAVEKLREKATGDMKTVTIPISITKDSQGSGSYYGGGRGLVGMMKKGSALRMKKAKVAMVNTSSLKKTPNSIQSSNFGGAAMLPRGCKMSSPLECRLSSPMSSLSSMRPMQVLSSKQHIQPIQSQELQQLQQLQPMQQSLKSLQQQFQSIQKCVKNDELSLDSMSHKLDKLDVQQKSGSKDKKKEKKKKFQEEKQEIISSAQPELQQIIKLQMFDGSWQLNKSLISLAERAGKKIQFSAIPEDFYPKLKKEERSKVFAISIALYLLESLYKDKKTQWKRIAIKGIKILKELGVESQESQDYIAKL